MGFIAVLILVLFPENHPDWTYRFQISPINFQNKPKVYLLIMEWNDALFFGENLSEVNHSCCDFVNTIIVKGPVSTHFVLAEIQSIIPLHNK